MQGSQVERWFTAAARSKGRAADVSVTTAPFWKREIDYQFFEEAKITHLETTLVGNKASSHLRELKVRITLKVKTSAVISTSPQTTNREYRTVLGSC